MLFFFAGVSAASAEQANAPVEVVALAKTYSSIEGTVRVTQIDRYQTLAQVSSETLPEFSASVAFKDDVRSALKVGQQFEGSFRLKPSHRDSPRFALVQTSALETLSQQTSWLDSLRSNFTSSARSITPDSGALVAGLAIGEDTALSGQMLERMKTLSLTPPHCGFRCQLRHRDRRRVLAAQEIRHSSVANTLAFAVRARALCRCGWV